MSLKRCFRCQTFKSLDHFTVDRTRRDGLKPSCRECLRLVGKKRYAKDKKKMILASKLWKKNNPERVTVLRKKSLQRHPDTARKQRLRKSFNMTLPEYQDMLTRQGGVCASCGRPETLTVKGVLRTLAVDHCHDTNKVRALLCFRCNVEIGLFEDNERVKRTLLYLQKHQSGCELVRLIAVRSAIPTEKQCADKAESS